MWLQIKHGIPRRGDIWKSEFGNMIFSVVVIAINIDTRECVFAKHITDEKHNEVGWYDEAGDYELDFEPTHFLEVPYS